MRDDGCYVSTAGSNEGSEREELGAGCDVEREEFPEEPQHLQGVDRTEATNPVLAGNRLELCHHAHQSSVLWDERIRQFPAG